EEDLLQLQAGEGVEHSEGLVEEEDLRRQRESPREAHALTHARGHLPGPLVDGIPEPDQLEGMPCDALPVGARRGPQDLGQREVEVLDHDGRALRARIALGDAPQLEVAPHAPTSSDRAAFSSRASGTAAGARAPERRSDSITCARIRAKWGSWLRTLRLRGRGRSTATAGPREARGPARRTRIRSASRIPSSMSLVIRTT